MAADQSMTQAIMKAAIEATKVEVMTVREADNPANDARPIHTIPRLGVAALGQSTFDWKTTDRYQELCNFKTEVKSIFVTNNCNIADVRGSQ